MKTDRIEEGRKPEMNRNLHIQGDEKGGIIRGLSLVVANFCARLHR